MTDTSGVSIVTIIDLLLSVFLKTGFPVTLFHLKIVTLQAFPSQDGDKAVFTVTILDFADLLLALSQELKNSIMNSSFKTKKILTLLGIVILMPPLYIQIVWFKVYGFSAIADEQIENKFLSYFPQSIQNIMSLVFVSFSCCILSIVISEIIRSQPGNSLKVIGIITTTVAWLLLIFDFTFILFSY